MNWRIVCLVNALLAAPAWSQQTTFDLASESVKRIIRATAATQFGEFRLAEEPPVVRGPAVVDDAGLRIEEKPPPKPVPVKPASQRQGPVSALIDALLEAESDISATPEYHEWLRCHLRVTDLNTMQHYGKCPIAPRP
jgi:hypothetical protein